MVFLPVFISIFAIVCILKIYTFDTPEGTRLMGGSSKAIEMFLWCQQQSASSGREGTSNSSSIASSSVGNSPRLCNEDNNNQRLNDDNNRYISIPFPKALSIAVLRWRLTIGFILSAAQQFSG